MRSGWKILGGLLLGLLVSGAAHAAFAAAPVDPEARERAEREGSARVVVHLAAPAVQGRASEEVKQAGRDAIARAADAALGRVAGPALRRYDALPLLAVEASPGELDALADSPDVLSIESDRVLRPSLAQSIPWIGADVTTTAGFDGAGAAVVIIDSGVESSHPFFGGRVVAEACFSSTRSCPNGKATQYGAGAAAPCTWDATCWHGTHVTGIAAGKNDTIHGVAPAASILAIQAGSDAHGTTCGGASDCLVFYDSDILAALDYVASTLSASYTIAAVNMSLGSDTTWSSESSCDAANASFKTAFDTLRALGIASVAAAGNGSITTGISSPACVSSAVGVGASLDTIDQVSVLSNSGPPLDLWAPGINITSSVTGGGYATHSGTSMATPHVTGAFAVLRQADPAGGVSTLLGALTSTGVSLTDGRNGLTRPRIQVDRAVRSRAPAACFDGLDNDADGRVDVDGDGGSPDPDCTSGWDGSESPPASPGCGIGPELAFLLPLLGALRARAARR